MSTHINDAESTQSEPDKALLHRAFRMVAGDLRPTRRTAFGQDHADVQPGWLDKRVILQTTWWVDGEAAWHRLEDMSHDYRANVLSHLEQESSAWIGQAMTWTYYCFIGGLCEVEQTRDELRLIDVLAPGWTHHTPLGRRLHELNGTAPDPLITSQLTTAATTNSPDILEEQDGGLWEVATESTTRYLIDLDGRRVKRLPGGDEVEAPQRAHTDPAVPHAPVAQLYGDGEWMGLIDLVHCHVGYSMLINDERPTGPGYRMSTAVVSICRLNPNPTREPGAA